MSNHWHGVVSDPKARLPQFLQELHRLIAKAQNAWLNRRENFWSSEKTSVVRLETDTDVLEKMAYTIANPTSALLVRSPAEWPGILAHWTVSRTEVEMPDVFFDKSGDLPKKIALDFERPQIFTQLTDEELMHALTDAVEVFVERARTAAANSGCSFLGAKAILNESFDSKPSTEELLGTLKPRIAAHSSTMRVRAIQRMQQFVRAYREAWVSWRDGVRDVLFPAGTYALRVHAGVLCAPS